MAVYYTKTEVDTLLLQKASYTHSHGVYEPIFSKTEGYSYWDGTQWQYRDEEYSLSSHLHTGTYQTYDSKLVDIVNITPTDGVFLVGNGTTWVSESGATARASLGAAGTSVSNTFSANQVISVTDNTNAALRITQTGTGNALVVEDSTSPDSNPFVIDGAGNVVIGHTVPIRALALTVTGTGTAPAGGINVRRQYDGTGSPNIIFDKSRGSITSPTVVQSGDTVMELRGDGYDGTNFIQLGNIQAVVDGTPSANDMPGRLVFSTTADGASSPTERLRITSSGNVGIGGVPPAGTTFRANKWITGSTNAVGFLQDGQIQSDATNTVNINKTEPSTAAASFTLASLTHYSAAQGAIGAGSAVTAQSGFSSSSTLIGATTNYGFYAGNTASVTSGKTAYGYYSNANIATGGGTTWNFYAAGTASNYFAGVIELGNTSDTTIARSAAGKVTIEGKEIVTVSDTQTLTNKTLTSPTITGLNVQGTSIFTNSGNTGLEIGRVDNVSSLAYLDFHTGATSIDFDTRILASGGTGTNGQGTITVYANTLAASGIVTGTSFNSITALSSSLPLVNGTATIGTSTTVARSDHVHPLNTIIDYGLITEPLS